MITFDSNNLEDGVEYFCVHKGIVYYLTARFLYDHVEDLASFCYEDIDGNSEEMFDAYECSLIYHL